jgi:Cysteine rich repeat
MRQMRHAASAFLAALAIAALTVAANAQVTGEEKSELRANCRSDFIAHCSGISPGGKEALVCLQKNLASLSPACKTVVSETMPKPAASQAVPPASAPAPSSPPPAAAAPAKPKPAPAAAAPVKQAPPAVTAAPATAVPAGPTPQQKEAIKSNCRRDYRRHCRGIPPGGPEALACLERNIALLRPQCKVSVAAVERTAPAVVAPPPPLQMPLQMPLLDAAIIARSCGRDLVRYCNEIQPGGGREVACLAAHRGDLRRRCRLGLERVGVP